MSWRRRIAVALAVCGTVLTLAALSFPYERIAYALSARSQAWTGMTLEIGELGPAVSWGGVGFEAKQARITPPGAAPLLVPRLFIRPSWTVGWLTGQPSLSFDLDGGALGRLEGSASLGRAGRWQTRFEEIQVEALPLQLAVPGLAMSGTLTGEVDLTVDERGAPQGAVAFAFSNGDLSAPGLPLALPFERLKGDILLGGEVLATVQDLTVESPLLQARIQGTVARAPRRGAEPLALVMELERVGPMLQPCLRQLDVPLARKGTTRLEITGTLGRPTFR